MSNGNINIGRMFSKWGISEDPDLMQEIAYNHNTDDGYIALAELGESLGRAYNTDELPRVLEAYSETLKGSILQFLSSIDEGAIYIVELINSEGP